jgi:glutathione S-transferase
MRARMGLLMSKQDILIRAIVTKDKPAEMLAASPKGTVPILVLENGEAIDESLDIMLWALKINDPGDLLCKVFPEALSEMLNFIKKYDEEFRPALNEYKHAKRFHLSTKNHLRSNCEAFISELDFLLQKKDYLFGNNLTLVDLAILPFIRQFVNVEKKWFRETSYTNLSSWLNIQMQSLLFSKTMQKYPLWLESNEEFLLTWN